VAVVINEFEVVAEAPATQLPAPPQAGSPAEAAPPTPYELERAVCRLLERAERVRAH
jgi:hypothetical protein